MWGLNSQPSIGSLGEGWLYFFPRLISVCGVSRYPMWSGFHDPWSQIAQTRPELCLKKVSLHLSWRHLGSLVPAGAHLGDSPETISIPEYPGHGVWEAGFLGNHLGQHLNCTDWRNEPPDRKQKSEVLEEPPMPKKSPGEERESTPPELCGRPWAEEQTWERRGESDA